MSGLPVQGAGENESVIALRGITAQTLIGAYAAEREALRTVEIDLLLALPPPAPGHNPFSSDQLTETIDYDQVVVRLRERLLTLRFYLIERLAEHIAQDLLARFPCRWARVTVRKPNILAGVAEVSITIERYRSAGHPL